MSQLWTGQQRREEWRDEHLESALDGGGGVGAVVAQPETQVILKGPTGEIEPANSPRRPGSLSKGSQRV
nr:hypothetical protein [Haloquadratum walsbyi]